MLEDQENFQVYFFIGKKISSQIYDRADILIHHHRSSTRRCIGLIINLKIFQSIDIYDLTDLLMFMMCLSIINLFMRWAKNFTIIKSNRTIPSSSLSVTSSLVLFWVSVTENYFNFIQSSFDLILFTRWCDVWYQFYVHCDDLIYFHECQFRVRLTKNQLCCSSMPSHKFRLQLSTQLLNSFLFKRRTHCVISVLRTSTRPRMYISCMFEDAFLRNENEEY